MIHVEKLWNRDRLWNRGEHQEVVLYVKETSCYVEGYTGDTYCSVCNIKLAEGTVIPKLEHEYEDNVCKTVEELIMPS